MTELEDMEARAERRGRSGPTSSANTTYLLQFEHGERDVFGFRDCQAYLVGCKVEDASRTRFQLLGSRVDVISSEARTALARHPQTDRQTD